MPSAFLEYSEYGGELIEAPHDAIIDESLWNEAQEILGRRSADARLRRGNPSGYLLTGLVRCGRCGSSYVGAADLTGRGLSKRKQHSVARYCAGHVAGERRGFQARD